MPKPQKPESECARKLSFSVDAALHGYVPTLPAYAPAMRSPVLTERMVLPGPHHRAPRGRSPGTKRCMMLISHYAPATTRNCIGCYAPATRCPGTDGARMLLPGDGGDGGRFVLGGSEANVPPIGATQGAVPAYARAMRSPVPASLERIAPYATPVEATA
eukprot:1532768-Rhodomonas_salina.1